MTDEQTSNYNLPLPAAENRQRVDVLRIRRALMMVDALLKTVGDAFSGLSNALAGKADASHSHSKNDFGLGNVDNTADADKPVSIATAQELANKADLANPTFTGVPKAPTAAAGNATTQLATTEFVDALRDVPQVSKTTAYTLALTDRGKSIDTTANVTIPANTAVAFPVGSVVSVFNNSAANITISITTNTLRQAGTTSTGTRTLAAYGVATLRKVAATVWVITGAGVS